MKNNATRIISILNNRWFKNTLFVLTLLIVSYLFLENFDWQTIQDITVDPVWFSFGVMAQVIWIFCIAALWHVITKMNSFDIGSKEAASVWLVSNFGKYLPIILSGVGYRLFYYRRKTGKPIADIAQAGYVELLASVMGGFLLLSPLAIFSRGASESFSDNLFYAAAICAFGLGLLLYPPVQRRIFVIGLGMFSGEPPTVIMGRGSVSLLALGYSLTWLLMGFSHYCLARSLYGGLTIDNLADVILIYTFAGLMGIFSFFAPSGIGVREGFMLVGLSAVMPPGLASVTTIVARVVATLIELVGIAGGLAYLAYTSNLDGKELYKSVEEPDKPF